MMTRTLWTRAGLVLALPVLAAVAWAGPVIDGQNIPSEFGSGALLASQRFQTQFGDHGDVGNWGGGAELDQLFVTNDADNLYIGLSGNLENNGNAITIFIDVDGTANGADEFYAQDFGTPFPGLPRFMAGDTGGNVGLDWMLFDAGFAPDFALGFSGGSPLGSQTRTYYLVNWTELAVGGDLFVHNNEIAGMITTGDATASGPAGTLGSFLSTASLGILGGADNTNTMGVEGGTGLWTSDPSTCTTGFEFGIPLSLLGVGVNDEVCVFAMVSGDSGWVANQWLPTRTDDPNSFDNPGLTRPLDFSSFAGDQFACYTVVAAQGCPNPGTSGNFCTADIDGSDDCVVGLPDLAALLSAYGNNANGDLNGDNVTNLADLALLLAQYGDNCN